MSVIRFYLGVKRLQKRFELVIKVLLGETLIISTGIRISDIFHKRGGNTSMSRRQYSIFFVIFVCGLFIGTSMVPAFQNEASTTDKENESGSIDTEPLSSISSQVALPEFKDKININCEKISDFISLKQIPSIDGKKLGWDNYAFNTMQKTITISEGIPNYPPIATFAWSPGRPYINEPVFFNASHSIDIDGTITQFSWDWESDGIIDAITDTPLIQTTFNTTGAYNITLHVQDDDESTNSTARPIHISKEWTITVPYDYPTIQDAIDHATSEDRIYIKSGSYYEHITITVDHVLLHGENKANTHLIATGNQPVIHLTPTASHVNISGFTIQGLQQTKLESIHSPSSAQSTGIFIESDYNIIQDTILKNHNQGITCDESYGNQIQETILEDNIIGIQLQDNTIATTIQQNTLSKNNEHGIAIDQTSHGNTIYNNSITQNSNYGIYISEVSKGNHISWNTLEYNAVGIYCQGASDGNLYHHNFLIDNNQNAFDTSYDRWNSEAQGNYWSDYIGEDIDGDGVGDTPYIIPGANNIDEFPLMNPPQHEKIDAAAMDIFFSSVERDNYRNYEMTELREGDYCWISTNWDITPDQFFDEYHWQTQCTSFWLDNEFYTEGGLYPRYPWYPNVYWTSLFIAASYTATPGNHTFKVIFDPYDKWDEANENNNEMTLNFTVSKLGDLSASFSWNPEKPLIEDTVDFDASKSSDTTYQITKYSWDWESDGVYDDTQTDPYISHQWSIPGKYNVTLQVTNSRGETDHISRMISILTKTSFIVPEDYPSIQEAINHATDGMSIHVQPGIYTEHLIINKSIHLYGPGPLGATIDGGSAEQHVVQITADNVVISGFRIQGSSIGFSGIRVYSNNNGIYNNYITDCGGGIELYFTMNNDICNNILEQNHWGMYLDHATNEAIEENLMSNNTFGLESGYSTSFIFKNTLKSNDEQGFLEIEDKRMAIHDNTITQNNNDGVRLFTTLFSDFNNNTISSNNGSGISLHKSIMNHVHDSLFEYNLLSDISFFFFSDDNTIDRNTFIANTTEALLIDYSHINRIYENEFSFDALPTDPCIIRIKADSTDNNVMHNIFLEQCLAYDTSGNNWDLGSLYAGNYWVEHSNSDFNQDGICEQPVNILGGGSQDHYPLLTPWDPPDSPLRPTGPVEGYPFKSYQFETKAIDPTEDNIQYGWDWNGDEIIDEWTDYQESNTPVSTSHQWFKRGTYDIQVITRDTNGHVSPWSQQITIEVYWSNMEVSSHANNIIRFMKSYKLFEKSSLKNEVNYHLQQNNLTLEHNNTVE